MKTGILEEGKMQLRKGPKSKSILLLIVRQFERQTNDTKL